MAGTENAHGCLAPGRRLLAGPYRITLLGESGCAFLGVSRSENMGDTRALQIEHFGLAPVSGLGHDAFCRLHGQRTIGRHNASQLEGRIERLARLDKTVDQAVAM